MSHYRYELVWRYTDIDGTIQSRSRRLEYDGIYTEREALEAYHRKVRANHYLLGGATITNVKLFKIKVEETWELIRGEE